MSVLKQSWSTISDKNAKQYLSDYPIFSKIKLAEFMQSHYNGKLVTMLELGCGALRSFNIVNSRYKPIVYTGVDFSQPLLNVARESIKGRKNINIVCSDVYDFLRSPNCDKYDIIFLSHTFELVESQDELLALIAKHSKLIAILWFEPPVHAHHRTELKPSAHPKDINAAPYIRIKTSKDYYQHLLDKHSLSLIHKTTNPDVPTDILHILAHK